MRDIRVWAVVLDESALVEELYQRALTFVDSESQVRIKKFYHRVDALRTLIGRLLARRILKDKGVHFSKMAFTTTQNGKPYLLVQSTDPPIAYNITHDNDVIAITFGPGSRDPPAYSLGIDVMKTKVPGKESLNQFIEIVGDQLSQEEHALLKKATTDDERIKMFFWMWTLKEAYTKALGVGLGFDFRRVEFYPHQRVVKVDGDVLTGWKFKMFTLTHKQDLYQGVVANNVGGTSAAEVLLMNEDTDWITIEDAVPFIKTTMSLLEA